MVKILRIAWNTIKILNEVVFLSPEKSAPILAVNVFCPATEISVESLQTPVNDTVLKAKVITLLFQSS